MMKQKQQAVDRIVFEIVNPTDPHGVTRVEVTHVLELAKHIQRLVPRLDTYAARGAAHLAFQERMNIQGKTWGVRRVGVVQFQADVEQVMPIRGRARVKASRPQELAATLPSSQTPAEPQRAAQPVTDRLLAEPLFFSQHGRDREESGAL
jgi:hypothetical protein